MSDDSVEPWSDNPNAPQISLDLYTEEKAFFAGNLIGGILYGIVITLFFRCVGALINPTNNTRRSVKLGLLAYTVILFSLDTMSLAMGRDMLSTIFIDTRKFPGTEEYPPGPLGGEAIWATNIAHITLINLLGFVTQWLGDGLLLYRCYVIYGMNYWAIALPSLIYVASIGVGLVTISFDSLLSGIDPPTLLRVSSSYYGVCLVLNGLLTLMIITKLVLHRRNLRDAIGTSNAATRVYTTVVIMLVESYALYAVALLSNVVTWALASTGTYITARVLSNVGVITAYLIILRVAERRALTSEMISSGANKVGSIRFANQGTIDGSFPGGDPMISMQTDEEVSREVGTRTENRIEETPL